MNIELNEVEAALVAEALADVASQVRDGLWQFEVDTSDVDKVADMLEAIAVRIDLMRIH